jgi:serine/threonine protein kinase
MAVMPARIGPYTVLSRLGAGGMAETYLALRRGPGAFEQHVCLKCIRREHESNPEFVRQFMREAAIAAKLRHAAIAQVLDFGSDGDDYYLALELVDGLDLRALLEAVRGGLTPELVLYVAIELATALDFAHRGGGEGGDGDMVVHRDVSPSNALVSGEGEVKLTDFGIARSLSAPQHTRTGIVKGKVPYLAPEYARSGRFDARCDLFSLGVLLYECACGERPHDGATDLETLDRAARGQHTPLDQRAPALPAELCAAIERLLEPDPELRFPSSGALLEALLALPAQSRARRELGALVTRVRKPRASSAPPPPEVLAPTRMLTRPGPNTHGMHEDPPAAIAVPRRKRGPMIALGVSLAFAAFVLCVAWLRPQRKPPSGPASATPAVAAVPPAPAAGSDLAIAAQPTPATVTPSAPELPPGRADTATLEVVMLPYGEIFVDGKRAGQAPITLDLPPGDHAIAGKGQQGSTLRRQVALSSGQHRRVVLR